jgi:hypothetical protein
VVRREFVFFLILFMRRVRLRIIAVFFSEKGGVVQSLERERTDVQKHRYECGLENNCFVFFGKKVVRTASMCSEFWKTGTEGIPVYAPIRPHTCTTQRVCSRSEMLHVRN